MTSKSFLILVKSIAFVLTWRGGKTESHFCFVFSLVTWSCDGTPLLLRRLSFIKSDLLVCPIVKLCVKDTDEHMMHLPYTDFVVYSIYLWSVHGSWELLKFVNQTKRLSNFFYSLKKWQIRTATLYLTQLLSIFGRGRFPIHLSRSSSLILPKYLRRWQKKNWLQMNGWHSFT